MQPTLKLRWHMFKNPVTREAVLAYRAAHDCSFLEAKTALAAETTPVLQQWWQDELGGEWRPVELCVEPHPPRSEVAG